MLVANTVGVLGEEELEQEARQVFEEEPEEVNRSESVSLLLIDFNRTESVSLILFDFNRSESVSLLLFDFNLVYQGLSQ